jgi:hypothetical protein
MKKKIIVNRFDTVLIKWLDACSSQGWKDLKDLTAPAYFVNTIGMFLGEDENSWTVCLNHAYADDTVSGTMSIPKGMIVYVEVIKRAV